MMPTVIKRYIVTVVASHPDDLVETEAAHHPLRTALYRAQQWLDERMMTEIPKGYRCSLVLAAEDATADA